MSDKAEDFAKQLLEKTDSGKLQWSASSEAEGENYRAILDDGYYFSIQRKAEGDNKVLSFWLTGPEGVVLSANADNLPSTVRVAAVAAGATLGGVVIPVLGTFIGASAGNDIGKHIELAQATRFRLFSDLFYAARRNAFREDYAIEKVQQLLERLG